MAEAIFDRSEESGQCIGVPSYLLDKKNKQTSGLILLRLNRYLKKNF